MTRGCAALCLALVSTAHFAQAAPQTRSCVDAYDAEQRRTEAGDLLGAREELYVCGRTSCPAVVVRQCVAALDALEPRIPTVTLAAKDASGADLSDVRVTLDGASWQAQLDGRELSVNPGPHSLVFSAKGLRDVEVRIVAREREKGRVVSVVFPGDPHAPPPTRPEGPPKPGPVPTVTFVLGGAALAAMGVFAYFAVSGLSARSDLDACSPFCPESQRDSARAKLRGADIALGIAVVALGGAIVTYVLRPHATPGAYTRAGRIVF